jgi:hypothetical protein
MDVKPAITRSVARGMSWVFVGLVSVVSLASAARAAKVPAARSSTPSRCCHGGFKTPSGNIVCEYFFNYPLPDGGKQNFIRCGILSGLKPVPPRRSSCFDNGDVNKHVLLLGPTGAVGVPQCEGDIGPFALQRSAPVLAYGRSWSGRGMSCTSAVTGLTCRNKSNRGFFLSRERWRSF